MSAALIAIALSIMIPDKLRLPSVGMVGLDAAGASALIARQIVPPPPVGTSPARKLVFVRQASACSVVQRLNRKRTK
jgi:hypothetical protein